MKVAALYSFLIAMSFPIFAGSPGPVISFTFSAERQEFVENIKVIHEAIPLEAAFVNTQYKKIWKKLIELSKNDPSLDLKRMNSEEFPLLLNNYSNLIDPFIHFSGHGTFKPEKVTSGYSAESIINAFHFPMDKPVPLSRVIESIPSSGIILSTQCYGGALNFATFSKPGSCSAAAVPWWRRGLSSPGPAASSYIKGFSNEIITKDLDFDKDGKTNLLEAHLSGMLQDIDNEGHGELSSWTFLDYKLCGGEFIFHVSLTEQNLSEIAPDCKDNSHLKRISSAGGFRPINSKILDSNKNFILFSQEELSNLPSSLVQVYEGLLRKGLLKYSPKASQFFSIRSFMLYLQKYLLARKFLSSEDLDILNALIECETKKIL